MITVITPCLNVCSDASREDYFHKMMNSIHGQSYKEIEHIIVDAGSVDGTFELLKKYEEKGWINCLISEKDSGIYSALNKGLKLAKGEFINIMNTDDYLIDLSFFERSISIIRGNNVDFSHADRIIKSRKNDEKDIVKKGEEKVAFFRMPFRHQTMIIKKSIFEDIGFFDEKYKIASDYKFILKMLLSNKKGVHIPEVVLCSLGGGISSNRDLCIEEVSNVLYESYGKEFRLTITDCKDIYLQELSLWSLLKILFLIKNDKIRKSLIFGYFNF